MEQIYLDYAASTPIDQRILAKYSADIGVGNSASVHSFGRSAQKLVDAARDSIAQFLNAQRVEDVVFTSGATEANNAVIWGSVLAARSRLRGARLAWPHVVTTTIEHSSILEPIKWLEQQQFCTVTYIEPDDTGRIDPQDVVDAVGEYTCLVSVQYANNEIGTVQSIAEIGAALKTLGKEHLVFHTDAVQAAQYRTCDVQELNVDALSLSAHKLYGPQGVGALYVAAKAGLVPHIQGGGQEFDKRAGTVNTLGVAQFGEAVRLLQTHQTEYTQHSESLRTYAVNLFKQLFPAGMVNGSFNSYVPHLLNISIPQAEAEQLITKLDLAGIAISAGSACHAGAIEPSHVIAAITNGMPDQEWRTNSAIRLSWGKDTTEEQLDAAFIALAK